MAGRITVEIGGDTTKLQTALKRANSEIRNTQSQYDGLQRKIAETEAKLKTLEEQANKSATALQKIAATGDKLKSVGNDVLVYLNTRNLLPPNGKYDNMKAQQRRNRANCFFGFI